MTQSISPLDQAAQQLAQSGNYRVLRRIPPVERWELPQPTGPVVRGAVVDTETTGLGDDDEPVEVAVVPFDYDKDTGRVVAVHERQAMAGLREAGKSVSEESTRIHGLTQQDLAGKKIDPAEVFGALGDAAIVVAHNAGFDRPMTEKVWPIFEQYAWACSCNEVDWKGEGFGSRSIEYLLFRLGWFYETHRALDDAYALLWLLTQTLPSGQPVLGALLASARKPQYVVRVQGSLFDERELLKSRGYRWEKLTRTWWSTVNDVREENEWLKQNLTWVDELSVNSQKVAPNMRYSRRLPVETGT